MKHELVRWHGSDRAGWWLEYNGRRIVRLWQRQNYGWTLAQESERFPRSTTWRMDVWNGSRWRFQSAHHQTSGEAKEYSERVLPRLLSVLEDRWDPPVKPWTKEVGDGAQVRVH